MKTPSRRGWSFSSSKTKGQVSTTNRKSCSSSCHPIPTGCWWTYTIPKPSQRKLQSQPSVVRLHYYTGSIGNCIFALVDQQGMEAVLQCYDSKGHKNRCSTSLEETMTRLSSLMQCAPSIRSHQFCVSSRTLGGLMIGTEAALLPFPQLVFVTKPPHHNKSNENVTLGCRCFIATVFVHLQIILTLILASCE